MSSRRATSTVRSIKDVLIETLEHLEYLNENGGANTGVPTGFADIDRMCNGLQKGEMTILAARPSMGKTSLGLNVAQRV